MHLGEFWNWLRARRRLLVYILGSCVVAIWTLLRFFTKRTIFDLVSQQVIVQQWLHGTMIAAHMGQTAYIPKMLLLYVPLDTLPGSPRLKLILLTLLINIASFVLLGIMLEKTLRAFNVRTGNTLYAALLWLSTIAGSVFWIEFANSRNLEVVGGLLWAYLSIRYLQQASWQRAVGLILLGGAVFFGDPLQVYMTAAPLLVYAAALTITKRTRLASTAQVAGITIAGYLLASLLFALAGHQLHITFTDTGSASTPAVSPSWALHSLSGTAKAATSLFAGAADAGRVRELVNIGFAAVAGTAFVYSVVRCWIPRRLVLLLVCMAAVDTAVYIASGQALQGEATSRYLIMLAPAAVLALAATRIPRTARPYSLALVAALVMANVALLGNALRSNWNTSFPQDAHLESAYRYISAHPKTHLYASTDTAMPVLYLHALAADRGLPLGCASGRLVRTYFSMGADFAHDDAAPNATAAILLDGDTITNAPNTCTISSVTDQLGEPLRVDHTDDGSSVLLYHQAQLQL